MSANQFGNDMRNDFEQLKKMDKGSFFNFDKLYFPFIAKWLFLLGLALIVISGIFMILGGLAAIFTAGVLSGLGVIVGAIIYVVVSAFLLRIWFEFILVLFNINDAVQDIRENCKK